MTNFTREQITQAELNATPAQLALYDTPEAGARIYAIAEKFGLESENAYRIFAILVGDIVLALIPRDDIEAEINVRLPGFDSVKSKELRVAIINYMNTPVTGDIQSEISELQKNLDSLQPLRTMSEDMRTDQGTDTVYSSSQEDLLSRKQTSSSGPRWDTDTEQ